MIDITPFQAIVCAILAAGLMPVICAGIAKWGQKNYDNSNPRAWYASVEGRAARANAAQQNCLEAFPFFAAGALLAAMHGAALEQVAGVSWLFVAIRVAYIACYLTNQASLRTSVWVLGYASVIYLYVMAL